MVPSPLLFSALTVPEMGVVIFAPVTGLTA